MGGYTAAVLTVSDRCSAGTAVDTSGPCVADMLRAAGYDVVHTAIVPDEQERIRAALLHCCDALHADLVVTTGGTGLSPRDVTPEATRAVLDREIPAIPQAMLYASLQITPHAMLSRAVAGTRGGTLLARLGKGCAGKPQRGAPRARTWAEDDGRRRALKCFLILKTGRTRVTALVRPVFVMGEFLRFGADRQMNRRVLPPAGYFFRAGKVPKSAPKPRFWNPFWSAGRGGRTQPKF